MDAGSRCVFRLRRQLHVMGIESDVLTYNWGNESRREWPDEYGTVWLADSWYRHARVRRRPSGKVSMSLLGWAGVILSRGMATLLGGRNYQSSGFPLAAAAKLGRRLRTLCAANVYDWAVSVSYPFVNHQAVLKWCPENQRIALYNLDPYHANGTYPPQGLAKRLGQELAAYEKCSAIFCTPEQMDDYRRPEFDAVRHKIYPLPYPNLEPPTVGTPSGIEFDKSCINLVYLGTVYADIRRPEALLKLFAAMVEKEPRLRLYIIGKKFGMGAEKYLEEYGQRLGSHLVVHAPVPPDCTPDILENADVLVNMGNTVPNQMPSKLIEYIATGKPMLNISPSHNCNTLSYIERHPLAFQCFNGEETYDNVVEKALAFCRMSRGKGLGWETVEGIYSEETVRRVAERFIEALWVAKKR